MAVGTSTRRDVLGTSALRPDGAPKVRGDFAFSSDMWAENMLWGATLRSPHPHARIVSVDIGPALAISGVHTVITAEESVAFTSRLPAANASAPATASATYLENNMVPPPCVNTGLGR